jgi:hypothetical protein
VVALPVIAFNARGNKVFPGIFSFFRFRDNMINRQTDVRPAAVLAAVAIAPEDIFSGKDNFLVWNVYVHTQSDDAGERHGIGHGSNPLAVMRLDQFCFAEPQENDRFLYVANAHRLVILIQDEHLTA